ncbi:MAG: hypothetical protein HQL15_08110 [Candidatus Omnitrophica bacterium]|nr:hypothetical protein [Candidatus Omnitrophota bacterium]
MLSEQDKKEMIEDANSLQRREAFAQSHQGRRKSMSWPEYFMFLKNIRNFFPQKRVLHKIKGDCFKL